MSGQSVTLCKLLERTHSGATSSFILLIGNITAL